MDVMEILGAVTKELANRDGWTVTHVEAKARILELFAENGIPQSQYEPWMGNNVLPGILLK